MRANATTISMLCGLALAAALTTQASCGDNEEDTGDPTSTQGSGGAGGGQGGAGGEGCFGSQIVCAGSVAHACNQPASAGEDCAAAGKLCVPSLGCAVCEPGTGTCSPSLSTYCRKDGSGYIEFACDADLGLACQGDACVGTCSPSGIEDSYLGCEYFPTTTINDVNNSYDFEVAVANASATELANVKISGGSLAAPLVQVVPPGGVERIKLPWVEDVKVCNESSLGNSFDQVNACSAAHMPDYSSRVVKGGAYRLTSDKPVAAYQFAPIQATKQGFQAGTTEASLLLPQTAFGNRYRVATYGQGFARGAIAIVATADGTSITVTPTTGVTPGGGNPSGIEAGKSGTYTANRGDVVEVISASTAQDTNVGDLTGTLIEADHPIQVLGAHGCAWVVNQQSCDHIEDAMLPDRTLGTDYLVKAATYPGSIAYLVRVIAAEDNVSVSFDPPNVAPPAVLAKAGDVVDVSAPDIAARIMTTGRVLVAGLNQGDNTLSALVPTARFRSDYLFYVPEFQHNYVKLLAPSGAAVSVDGTPVPEAMWTAIGASGYRWAIVPVQSGPHRATSPSPFGLTVYGNQDPNYVPGGLPSAYEYPGGLDLHGNTDDVPK
jgi:hypothetical protein